MSKRAGENKYVLTPMSSRERIQGVIGGLLGMGVSTLLLAFGFVVGVVPLLAWAQDSSLTVEARGTIRDTTPLGAGFCSYTFVVPDRPVLFAVDSCGPSRGDVVTVWVSKDVGEDRALLEPAPFPVLSLFLSLIFVLGFIFFTFGLIGVGTALWGRHYVGRGGDGVGEV